MPDVTRILRQAREGQSGASEELAAVLYDELRQLARRELANERVEHTLQPTALVHEAWMRLMGDAQAEFESRAHFFGAAARAIRRVLVDHARARARVKRGGGAAPVPLDDTDVAAPLPEAHLLALDEALERLAAVDPYKARLVELRFFSGLSVAEVARLLGTSESSVGRDWRVARAWLRGELDGDHGP